MPLGVPKREPVIKWADGVAVLVSLACLAAAIATIVDDHWLSWRLGFGGQIIMIGFLLSIMNLCLRTICPLLLVALPIGLSVAYKRYIDGTSTVPYVSTYDGYYGLAPLPLGNYNVINNSLYLMTDASVPFLAASASEDIKPLFNGTATAHGYNILMLDSNSAAILDLPMPDYITSIQDNLCITESWTRSAAVLGTVLYNNNFWEETFYISFNKLTAFGMWNGFDEGLMMGSRTPSGASTYSREAYSMLGYISPSLAWNEKNYNSPNASESLAFRSAAQLFDIRRRQCHGTWKMRKSDVTLVAGHCSNKNINQTMISESIPFYLDILLDLAHALQLYPGIRNESLWRWPALANAAAMMWWARAIQMNPFNTTEFREDPSLCYPAPADEEIFSTNYTLNATSSLYVVLAIQPLMTVAIFCFIVSCRKAPIGKGVGVVAILASVDKADLDLLQGAPFSGQLKQSVRMDVRVGKDKVGAGRLRYTIGRVGGIGKEQLRERVKYG